MSFCNGGFDNPSFFKMTSNSGGFGCSRQSRAKSSGPPHKIPNSPPPVRTPRSRSGESAHSQPSETLLGLLGPVPANDPWMAAEAGRKLVSLKKIGWQFSFDGRPISPVLGQFPAKKQIAWPGMTISRLMEEKGRPTDGLSVCAYRPGGIVGSSRRSRSRAARTGRSPWRAGKTHADWIPLERVLAHPPIPTFDGHGDSPQSRPATPSVRSLASISLPQNFEPRGRRPFRISSPNNTPLGHRAGPSARGRTPSWGRPPAGIARMASHPPTP